MKLFTVGDSFTFCEELSDVTDNLTSSKYAWPALLADKLECKLTNLAKPGGGNTRMIRHCIEQVDNYDMIIIAWSHFARIELADEIGFYDIWPGQRKNSDFVTNASFRNDMIEYYTRHHNDSYLYNQYLINTILLQNFLKSNNKKYIMLDAFGNNKFDGRYNYAKLMKQINISYYLGWPNETMMEWTYGCSKGPGGHFLEQGHEQVANKIYEHIRHLGWIS